MTGTAAGDHLTFRYEQDGFAAAFRRGDCNYDGWVDTSDASFGLGFLCLGQAEPSCGGLRLSCHREDGQ